MLEELAGDDDVEGVGLEWKRIVEVGPARLDSELLRLRQRLAVGVDADDRRSRRHRPVSARRRGSPGRARGARARRRSARKSSIRSGPAKTKPRPRSTRLCSAYRSLSCSRLTRAPKYTPAGEHEASRADRASGGAGRRHPLGPALPPLPQHASRRRQAPRQRCRARHARPRRPRARRLCGAHLPRALLRRLAASWGIVWETESEWLPFLALITVLVFWRGGLYGGASSAPASARSSRRSCSWRVITLAFGIGTGYHFTTFGLFADRAVVTTAFFIGVLRASYEVLTRDVLRLSGHARRRVLVGEGEQLARLRRTLGAGPQRHSLRVPRRDRSGAARPATCRCSAASTSCRACSASTTSDELIVTDGDFARGASCSSSSRRRIAAASKVQDRADDDRAADCSAPSTSPARACRSSSCARRCSPGSDWALKRGFDLVVSERRDRRSGSPLWLADRRSRSSSPRPGRSSTATGASGSASESSGC